MKNTLISLLTFLVVIFTSCKQSYHQPKVLLITGGHAFDTTEFFEMFRAVPNIRLDTMTQPAANKYLATEAGKEYDVYIFYDMWNSISKDQKQAYLNLAEKGKGFIFLHHSLVSYQEWDEFKSLVGGRYHEPGPGLDSTSFSTYQHDLDLYVIVVDPSHPVTAGMSNFIIHDEGYGNLDLTPDIQPLLTTDHPDCHPVIAWTNQFKNSKVVYLIFGHDRNAYKSPELKALLINSITWTIP